MDRRAWLHRIAALIGAAGSFAILRQYLSPQQVGGISTVDLGLVDTVLPDGQRRLFSVNGETFLIARLGVSVRALAMTCTHAGCPLTYDDRASRIRCGCHGGAFALTGEPLAGPPRVPLAAVPCAIEQGRLYLRIATRGEG